MGKQASKIKKNHKKLLRKYPASNASGANFKVHIFPRTL